MQCQSRKYQTSIIYISGKGVAPSPTPWCSKLSKREPSGHPRLWSPTLLYIYILIVNNVSITDYTARRTIKRHKKTKYALCLAKSVQLATGNKP